MKDLQKVAASFLLCLFILSFLSSFAVAQPNTEQESTSKKVMVIYCEVSTDNAKEGDYWSVKDAEAMAAEGKQDYDVIIVTTNKDAKDQLKKDGYNVVEGGFGSACGIIGRKTRGFKEGDELVFHGPVHADQNPGTHPECDSWVLRRPMADSSGRHFCQLPCKSILRVQFWNPVRASTP
jgi:hypothetical protein